jgi:hypothetical protein
MCVLNNNIKKTSKVQDIFLLWKLIMVEQGKEVWILMIKIMCHKMFRFTLKHFRIYIRAYTDCNILCCSSKHNSYKPLWFFTAKMSKRTSMSSEWIFQKILWFYSPSVCSSAFHSFYIRYHRSAKQPWPTLMSPLSAQVSNKWYRQ